ncbi:hypothetical protein [Streptomyces sp. 1222.2]|uniref:hypothetical protein n=1 Tax=Streptomyces sp. 1222.2 TaxID=1938833 RepID=UPI0011805208|nr:hypothetical protein [Streptomyces sp. 1222.2]
MVNATPQTTDRPSLARIAVLEHDLLGIQPEPGTAAALAVWTRRLGQCWQHQPAATVGEIPIEKAVCTQCGRRLILNDGGYWVLA